MAIKKIKLPNNTTEDINDPRLPAVTATDNGKVLSVSGGIWSANSKPSYTLDEVADGSTRKLANYLPLTGGTMSNTNVVTNLNADLLDGYSASGIWDKQTKDLGYSSSSMIYKKIQGMWATGTKHTNVYILTARGVESLYIYCGSTDGTDLKPFIVRAADSYSKISAFTFDASTSTLYVAIVAYSNNVEIGQIKGIVKDLTISNSTQQEFESYSSVPIQTAYHSNNSNRTDASWTCSTLSVGTAGTGIRFLDSTSSWRNEIFLDSANCLNIGSGQKSSNPTYIYGNTIMFYPGDGTNGVLYVNSYGHTILGGTASSGNRLYVNGNIVATGTITPGSDSRIKDNQKDISSEDAFSVIENLKPKTWVWNEKSNEKLNGKSAAGLVAQEVKEVVPDAVTISENGDIKDFHSLNYNTVQGYEIAAIKGLIEEVKSLKAEIVELKKQIK